MRSKTEPSLIDLSVDLCDELDWKAGTLRTFEHHLDISAWAYEPLSGLLAIGTNDGTIDLYGGPGVECRLQLSEPIRIRSLHFASSVFKLLCVDVHDRLHIWDLTSPSTPKLQHIKNFTHPVNYVAVSPSHTHAFVALSNGEIQSYDLLCLRMSPYVIPNMWAMHEEKLLAGDMQSPGSTSHVPIEVSIHPRNLNLLFVGYAGGVILLDLTQRKTLKAYEYFLPPGAPGGFGYHHSAILTTRKPELSAMAIHPSGHLIATGHTDGSVVFWAVEDEDKPLSCITLDGAQNINTVNADELDAALAAQHGRSDHEREPIFKLAWSGFANSTDPRGGETVLTALGGVGQADAFGVTSVLLPAFNPPEPPAQTVSGTSLDPSWREAVRKTVIPTKSHCYTTSGVPQDFLLIPREQPYFSGNWDPACILLLSDADKEARATEAYQFPPPVFLSKVTEAHKSSSEVTIEDADADEKVAEEIASTLESFQLDDEPRSLSLPPALWSGPSCVISGALVNLERDAYEVLIANKKPDVESEIGLRGGSAWVDDAEGEMKLMRFQPRRVLVSHHTDLTVRFRDLSAQLLVSSDTTPLQSQFPGPLPDLSIDLLCVLADPAVSTRTSPKLIEEACIVSSHVATQSLECAVVLSGGEIAVFRQGPSSREGPITQRRLDDQELISTAHIPIAEGRKFQPSFLILCGKGPVTACSFADIGFFAAAFQDGSFFVVDMRGPKIMLRNLPEANAQKRTFLHKHEIDPVQNLTWTIAGTDDDPRRRILLLATRHSGHTTIHSLSRASNGSWSVDSHVETSDGATQPLPDASIVIDSKNGNKCRADRAGLAATLSAAPEETAKGRTIWVSAGSKGVRCVVDITGDRIARTEWPSKAGKVERVAVIHKNTSTVLVAHTDRREALVYSLPFLEHMHSLQLHQSSAEPLSLDDTGDYIEWCRHAGGVIKAEKYGTLFNVRRSGPYKPVQVDLTYGRKPVPPQPQPVSMGPTSVFNSILGYITNQGVGGDTIDALLAGPDRPVPKQKPPQKPTLQDRTSDDDGGGRQSPTSAQSIAASTSRGVGDLYTRLNNALAERGEMLGGLEDSFNNLESGSKNMLAQAKNLAAKQTAKRWFNFSG